MHGVEIAGWVTKEGSILGGRAIAISLRGRHVSARSKRALLIGGVICIPIGITLGFFVGWGLGIPFLIADFCYIFLALLLEASDSHKP